jgi:hypothetical protein
VVGKADVRTGVARVCRSNGGDIGSTDAKCSTLCGEVPDGMPTSDFIILLARQRSGTNPLRSVLGTHPDVFCVPEVFNDRPSPDWELEVETNYVNFLGKRAGGDLRSVLAAADHRELFLDFLEYLRAFSDKRYMLIDVKYNSTHHVMKYWRFISEEPLLFTLLKEQDIRVLNLTRRNYLRYWLSEVKAHLTQSWEAFDERVVGDRPWYQAKYANRPANRDPTVRLDVAETLATLELCRAENEIVAASFAGYEHYRELEYEDLFSEIGAPVSDDALRQISDWLGIALNFAERRPQYKKQSAMRLADTIENYAEIAAALTATPFESCLEDERLYRASAALTAE